MFHNVIIYGQTKKKKVDTRLDDLFVLEEKEKGMRVWVVKKLGGKKKKKLP